MVEIGLPRRPVTDRPFPFALAAPPLWPAWLSEPEGQGLLDPSREGSRPMGPRLPSGIRGSASGGQEATWGTLEPLGLAAVGKRSTPPFVLSSRHFAAPLSVLSLSKLRQRRLFERLIHDLLVAAAELERPVRLLSQNAADPILLFGIVGLPRRGAADQRGARGPSSAAGLR